MAGLGSRWAALSGRRFLLRRMDYAILGRSMPAVGDPLRAESLALPVGCLLALALLVGSAAMAVLRPAAGPGGAPLVMARGSGALFVRVGEDLRPVANMASARLILNEPAQPRVVDDDRLGPVSSGPVLGIPGAPQRIGEPIASGDAPWTVCDGADGTTTVAVGSLEIPPALARHTGVLVAAAQGEVVYLLYDGGRAAVDPADPVIARTLHLDGVRPRRVSSTLLTLVPEAPPITAPHIAGAGGVSLVGGRTVGSVLRVARAGTEEYYVVLRDGLQRIGGLTADLIRFGDPRGATEITTVAADLVAASPLVDTLPSASYPDRPPRLGALEADLCATWAAGRVTIGAGSVAAGSAPVRLARADGAGPAVDQVRMPPGRCADVTVTDLAGRTGSAVRYLINDAGVRFALHDSATAVALGLARTPAVAPWPLVATLPAGPELGRDAALVARDVSTDRPTP